MGKEATTCRRRDRPAGDPGRPIRALETERPRGTAICIIGRTDLSKGADGAAAECRVLIGATPEGRKELLGFQVGVRESAQSWRELLVDLKARGLAIAPELATGDGALGFWKALEEVSPTTRHQRCTVHKTANVLDKLPKSVQPAVKADLREIWTAPDRATAEAAITAFAEKYGAKYAKAVACLIKDRDTLLTFYDFPAEHWDHPHVQPDRERVCHRPAPHGADQGALSQDTALLMVFKRDGRRQNLAQAEGRTIAQSLQGVTFRTRRGHQHPAQDAG